MSTPGNSKVTICQPYDSRRRSPRYSWMLSGWTTSGPLDATSFGTEFVTISVPDDFYGVRVGLANVNTAPWTISKIIACSSSCLSDYINPVDTAGLNRPASAWSILTFQNEGKDDSSIVTKVGAPTVITVAGNATDLTTGEQSNPAWTFTDWVPCVSLGADPATGMRILMLRALVPGNQTVTFTNGALDPYNCAPHINRGYEYFVGGVKEGHDLVTDPGTVGFSTEALRANRIVNGQIMCLIQVITKHAGIVGMITGDSHHSGSSTQGEVNNLLVQCLLSIGQENIGAIPVGIVNVAVGGANSSQFFPRLVVLLNAVRPTFVVMPSWSANELDVTSYATQRAEDVVFARMLLTADAVRDAGAAPIFLTPFPRDAAFMTPAVLTAWLSQREAVLSMRASGELVVDAASFLGAQIDGRLTGTYRDGLSSDALHPNDAGHAVLARILTPVVQRITGIVPILMPPPARDIGVQ